MLEFEWIGLSLLSKVNASRLGALARAGFAVPVNVWVAVARNRERRNLSPEALQLLMTARQSGEVHEPPGVEGRLAVAELKRLGYIKWVSPVVFYEGQEIPYWTTESGDQRIAQEVKRQQAA